MAIQPPNVPVKRQDTEPVPAERTRERAELSPDVDIIERKDDLYLVADLPGVVDSSVDINVEKNVLTISARVQPEEASTAHVFLREYELGDYRRSFTLSNEVDQTGIEATLRDGVLRLRLPKAKQSAPRKIKVKAG